MKIKLKPIPLNGDWKKNKSLWVLAVCLVLAVGFHIVSGQLIGSLLSQQAADRWDADGGSRQVSAFFADGTMIDTDTVLSLEHQLSDKLEQDSIVAPSEQARLWVDAYSAKGTVTLSNGRAEVSANAYGVGGDYFFFHPLTLKRGGSYLTSEDAMQDRVILDEATAWRLYGSYDVAGQEIAIGSGPNVHIGIVAGVIESEEGYLNEKAGASSQTVYLSYGMLQTYGSCSMIQSYEVVMPNPINGYAKNTLQELLSLDESQLEVIENTSRFDFFNRWKILLQYGTRSMNTKSIIYPYWENTARGCEDILMIFTLFETLSWAAVCFILVRAGIRRYRKHPLSLSAVKDRISAQIDARRERNYLQQKKEDQ